jgi:hypothetical protein
MRPAIASGPGTFDAGRYSPVGASLALLGLLLSLTVWTAGGRPLDQGISAQGPARGEAASAYAKLPVSFIPNRGQIKGDARYYAQGGGYGFFFTKRSAVISLVNGKRTQVLDLSFLGANPNPAIVAGERARGKVNYLTGNVHHTNIPTYKSLVYRDLWPGIDMVFKGSGGKLRYEFLVSPGADPGKIHLAWQGADGLSITSSGELSVGTSLGPLMDARPRSYQEYKGRKIPIESAFALKGSSNSYGFSLGRFDHERPLVIDPSLAYSTYLPGSTISDSPDIVVDAQGNAYLTGGTYGQGSFPTTPGAFDTTGHNGGTDAFVTKLSPDGSSLVYSTFLGGADHDQGYGIAVDGSGRAYVTGYTYSSDFPTTLGAYKPNPTVGFGLVQETFVTRLSADGSSLSYSTYLGGTNAERGYAVALGSDGSAYVAGTTYSSDFPTTVGAYDTSSNGAYDVFVTKLNPTGSLLTYSTYLGGSSDDSVAAGVAVDGNGSAYLTGGTQSSNFPTTPGAYDTTPNGGFSDTYIAKLSPNGSSLAYSTFLPGGGTSGIAVDAAGSAYVTGDASSASFPTTPGAYDTTPNGSDDAFVTKLSTDGSSLAYSTLIGGFAIDYANGLALDGSGNAYVAGYTTSTDYPTSAGAHDTNQSTPSCNAFLADAFVTRLNATGTGVSYSSYLGGCGGEYVDAVAVGPDQGVYVTGTTVSPDFPVSGGAYNTTPPVQVLDPRYGGYYYSSRTFVTKLFTTGSELSTAGLIVRKDARPDTPKDFSFNAGGGLSPASFNLDDDPADPTLSYLRHFHPVAPGSGYSISENDPIDWKLTSAVCSDGSPTSNIALSAGETVSCTFVNESKGYARPKSAPSIVTKLVPAFEECTSPNGNHGAPLALPSCDPARPSSSYLTFASPDRTAPYKGPAAGSGLLELKVVCTDGAAPPCASPGDQEDVRITAALEGVRCVAATGGCSSAGANYAGKVLFSLPLRLTDRLNGPEANWPGTVADTVLTFGVACSAGICNVGSSVEAVTPIVPEQQRSIWQLGQVRVLDGGQDGDFAEPIVYPGYPNGPCPPRCVPNDGETVFLTQGLFAP